MSEIIISLLVVYLYLVPGAILLVYTFRVCDTWNQLIYNVAVSLVPVMNFVLMVSLAMSAYSDWSCNSEWANSTLPWRKKND